MVNEKETHFEHAKRIVKSWPKWKQIVTEQGLNVPKQEFNVDGVAYDKCK